MSSKTREKADREGVLGLRSYSCTNTHLPPVRPSYSSLLPDSLISLYFSLTIAVALLLALPAAARARTTCTTTNGMIVVTMYISFAGASNNLAATWTREILDVWNGPQKHRTYGDCGCPVVFRTVTNCVAAGSPMRPGWHLVNVIPQRNGMPILPYGPSKNRPVVAYMGKTTISPPRNGASVDGEWSEVASRPVDPLTPTGEHYRDAAHEAGHMMGLPERYDNCAGQAASNIMGQTTGPCAVVTPDLVRTIVDGLTGKSVCPLCGRR